MYVRVYVIYYICHLYVPASVCMFRSAFVQENKVYNFSCTFTVNNKWPTYLFKDKRHYCVSVIKFLIQYQPLNKPQTNVHPFTRAQRSSVARLDVRSRRQST